MADHDEEADAGPLLLSPTAEYAGGRPQGLSPVCSPVETGALSGASKGRATERIPTVTRILGLHGLIVCTERSTLGSAAAQMLARRRSFAILADRDGTMFGALTENDILHAYACGVPAPLPIGAWLTSGFARLPDLEHIESVGPDATLLEAAQTMRRQQDSEFASRHVVISDVSDNSRRGIVSCLDIVRCLHTSLSTLDPAGRLRGLHVRDIMKPMHKIPTCPESSTVMHAVQKMIAFKQNFVVVHRSDDFRGADDEVYDDEDDIEVDDLVAKHVQGILTIRDTLRTYVDRTGQDVSLEEWFSRLEGVSSRCVKADLPFVALVRKLATEDIHHVVVVDDDNILLGALSSSDVAHMLAVTYDL